jgi:hypothetical protein
MFAGVSFCVGQTVKVEWDKSASFSDYKTYACLQGTPTPAALTR